MRELNFRAWDVDVQEMVTLKQHVEQEIENGYMKREHHNENVATFFERFFGCEIMQFTGLKGKNGVAICEGDIVESTLPRNKFFDDIAKVVFRKGSFMMKSVEFEDETSCLIDSEQFIEVIGNIYENEGIL